MSAHHAGALLEAAKLELDRVHRAAIDADAGELRRGLDLALLSLQGAADAGLEDDTSKAVLAAISSLKVAQSDLDGGALAEMTHLIEAARTSLAAL